MLPPDAPKRKKCNLLSFLSTLGRPKCTKNQPKINSKTTSKNTSFSEPLLERFGCICACIFPPNFALFRVPKANERKNADPYDTLLLCSEIKGRPFEISAHFTEQIAKKLEQKTLAKPTSENVRFGSFFGSLLGDFWGDFWHKSDWQKKLAKTRLKTLTRPTGIEPSRSRKLCITQSNY